MNPSMSDLDESYLDTTPADDLKKARERTAQKSPTSGPRAEKHHEDDEEDLSKMAQNFSMIAEKVSKAIPQRYQDSSVPTIYVVPRDLMDGTKHPYEPEVVCIGPLFNQAERAKKPRRKLESYKWCCLRKLLVNAQMSAGAVVGRQQAEDDAWLPRVHEPLLRKCLETVKDLVPRIRDSYSDISMADIGGSDMLALMMLLDGSFLLHRLMVEYARTGGNSKDDDGKEVDDDDWTQVVGRCGIWGIVTRDLLLLKNQIPFFLLQALLEHLRMNRVNDEDDTIIIKGGLQLFADLRPGPAADSSSNITCRDVHHLLHLFYKSIGFTQSGSQVNNNNGRLTKMWVPCAKELEEAGVAFHPTRLQKKQQMPSFLDMRFFRGICGGGVLEIPPLELYDYSDALFRNLVAFEQTYLHTPGHITAYVLLMDCLIKTPEDMLLLHQSGVLVSHMNGDRDVATTFFSHVCAQAHISWDQNYLQGLMEDVVSYQSTEWGRYRAALKRDYFSNPWVTISLVPAFLALAVTVLQTFYTVYIYYKPK